MRPYDKTINPTESIIATISSFGEGYHNYHHTFPSDYSTSEFGWKYNFNYSTLFIDAFAKIGWAYDLKKVSKEMIIERQKRTGDILNISMNAKSNNKIIYWIVMNTAFFSPKIGRASCRERV